MVSWLSSSQYRRPCPPPPPQLMSTELPADRYRYGGNLMLKHEYIPFQYVVVYIAVLQVSSSLDQANGETLNLTFHRAAWVQDSG